MKSIYNSKLKITQVSCSTETCPCNSELKKKNKKIKQQVMFCILIPGRPALRYQEIGAAF